MKSRALNRTVIVLGFVSLAADIASEMLYPINPLFMTSVLGASMMSVGLVEGFAEAVASILKIASGRLSDASHQRRPWVFWGYFLSSLAKPLTGFAGNVADVLGARFIDRFGKGIRTGPRDALIAESVSSEKRGEAFGWHRGMDTLGACIGPLLALALLAVFSQDLRKIYFFAIVPGLISAFLVLLIREPKHTKVTTETQLSSLFSLPLFSLPLFSLKTVKLGKPFWLFTGSWAFFVLANSSDVFLLLRARSLGFDLTGTVLCYVLYNFVYAAASPSLGKLSDRVGSKKVLLGGLAVFAFVYLGFAVAVEKWMIVVLFAVYGLYAAATDGVGKSHIVNMAPPESKATALGWFGAVSGIGALIASTGAGALWDIKNPSAPFFIGALGALLSLAALAWVSETGRGAQSGVGV